MLKETKEIYNEKIFSQICKRFEIEKEDIKLLNGFESFIYEFSKYDQDFILRVTHSLHRNEGQIKAEVDWVNYLADGGVSVSKAVRSPRGNLVERIDEGDTYFLAIAFEKAAGRHVRKEDKGAQLYRSLGEVIGKMHHLSKSYQPKKFKRTDWYEQDIELLDHIPADQKIVQEKFKQLLETLNTLPKNIDDYGLIHTDTHFGNIFIDDGKLTVFDFDDSAYKWFISDIAIVLFYAVLRTPETMAREEFGEFILENFMKGYKHENQLDPFWFSQMPFFLKLREIVLYAVIHMGFDIDELEDPWCISYLAGRKEKIEQDIPFLDLDYNNIMSS